MATQRTHAPPAGGRRVRGVALAALAAQVAHPAWAPVHAVERGRHENRAADHAIPGHREGDQPVAVDAIVGFVEPPAEVGSSSDAFHLLSGNPEACSELISAYVAVCRVYHP